MDQVLLIVAFQILFLLINFGCSKQLPSNFKKCKRNDLNMDECLKRAIQENWVYLKDGIPDLHLNPLEPFAINDLKVTSGSGGVTLKQRYKNTKLHGLSKIKFNKVQAKIDDTKLELLATTHAPKIRFDGEYDYRGQILAIPMNGNGKFFIETEDANITIKIVGKVFKKKDNNYIKIDTVENTYNPASFKIHIENLFNGNEVLSNQMNRLLNENWEDVHKELQPSFLPVFSNLIKEMCNHIFSRVPFDDIFPPS